MLVWHRVRGCPEPGHERPRRLDHGGPGVDGPRHARFLPPSGRQAPSRPVERVGSAPPLWERQEPPLGERDGMVPSGVRGPEPHGGTQGTHRRGVPELDGENGEGAEEFALPLGQRSPWSGRAVTHERALPQYCLAV